MEKAPDTLGIYVHIPFCASKCGYCDFYSLAGKESLMDKYQDALLYSIRENRHVLTKYIVDTIYFGGGTPSYYGADRLCEILEEFKENGNVLLSSEITVECNPDSMDYQSLKKLRAAGVNRISIGMQSANNELLRILGRRHTFDQVKRAVNNARDAGFGNISLDLMYGLPGQMKADWAETLSHAISLHPEHISAYALTLEEGTPMYAKYYGSEFMPSEDDVADMYCYTAEMLTRYGYTQYEISNFAIEGFESAHNNKYWNLDDYMGFGPGAHSFVGNVRYSYIKDLKKFIDCTLNGRSDVIDECDTIEPLERAVEYIMLSMRTTRGISEDDYHKKCQADWRPIKPVLEIFKSKGWVEQDGKSWRFTVPGYLSSNTLINIMLEAQTTGHVESVPWIKEAYKAEEKIAMPRTEEEEFIEIYKAKLSAKKL